MKIKIKGINKSYKGRNILRDVNITIEDGDRIAIMGPSGIGKTTLISIIAGIVKVDSGEIITDCDLKPALVFQDNLLLEELSVYKNIEIVNSSLSKSDVVLYLKELGLADVIDEKVKNLSGGMKRRIAILRAIVFESNILLMDEAIKEVDQDSRDRIVTFINKYIGSKPIVFVTHNSEDIKDFKANKILNLGGHYERRV